MAKKRNVRRSRTTEKEEEPRLLDEKEQRDMEYIFLALFAASIVFLLVYLVGLVSILLK